MRVRYSYSLGYWLLILFWGWHAYAGPLAEGSHGVVPKGPGEVRRAYSTSPLEISIEYVRTGDHLPSKSAPDGFIVLTKEQADEVNRRLEQAKSDLLTSFSDPVLLARGLENLRATRRIRLSPNGMSRAGKEIEINPLFSSSPDDLLAVMVHEQIHLLFHDESYGPAPQALLNEVRTKVEHEVPGFARRLNEGKVPGVNPDNKECLPPKALDACTWEHVVVNWLERRSMERLWGKEKSDRFYSNVIENHGIYAGIYEWLSQEKNSTLISEALERYGISLK